MNASDINAREGSAALSTHARNPFPWRTALLAGCVAATIDILFAFAFFGWQLGVTPQRVLQSVASGLFGADAFTGGAMTAAAGFAAHYVILIVAATLYVLAAQRIPMLNRRAIASGIAFGIAIYIAMTFVIVPLSAARMRPLSFSGVNVGQFLIHPVIGIAIALIARRRLR